MYQFDGIRKTDLPYYKKLLKRQGLTVVEVKPSTKHTGEFMIIATN